MHSQLGYNQFNSLSSEVQKMSAVDQYNQQLAEWEQSKNGGSSTLNSLNVGRNTETSDTQATDTTYKTIITI